MSNGCRRRKIFAVYETFTTWHETHLCDTQVIINCKLALESQQYLRLHIRWTRTSLGLTPLLAFGLFCIYSCIFVVAFNAGH